MQYIMPAIEIPNDKDSIMRRSGDLVGVTRSRAVWRFGFLPGSDSANAYGVSVDAFYWILADKRGKTLDTFQGFAAHLPNRFWKIIDSDL